MSRWNLSIPPTTDRLVRTHLAARGFKKGDLSRFVDEAVRRAVFWATVDAARERNANVDPAELEAEINAAVSEARADRS